MAFLADLPCRGNFTESATVCPGNFPVYLCDHDTRPPDNQVIRTDSTNILIRALSLKRSREEAAKAKESRGQSSEDKGKRPIEATNIHGPPSKRLNSGKGGGGASSVKYSDRELQVMTVERLRSLLKELGVPTRGKKEDLIARLMQVS